MQMIGAAGATAALSLGPSGNPLVLAVVIASAGAFAVIAFGSLVQFASIPGKAGARAYLQRLLARRLVRTGNGAIRGALAPSGTASLPNDSAYDCVESAGSDRLEWPDARGVILRVDPTGTMSNRRFRGSAGLLLRPRKSAWAAAPFPVYAAAVFRRREDQN
jgi:hypothetical protein